MLYCRNNKTQDKSKAEEDSNVVWAFGSKFYRNPPTSKSSAKPVKKPVFLKDPLTTEAVNNKGKYGFSKKNFKNTLLQQNVVNNNISRTKTNKMSVIEDKENNIIIQPTPSNKDTFIKPHPPRNTSTPLKKEAPLKEASRIRVESHHLTKPQLPDLVQPVLGRQSLMSTPRGYRGGKLPQSNEDDEQGGMMMVSVDKNNSVINNPKPAVNNSVVDESEKWLRDKQIDSLLKSCNSEVSPSEKPAVVKTAASNKVGTVC